MDVMEYGNKEESVRNEVEKNAFQTAFDGGLDSFTRWLESLPKSQRMKIKEIVAQAPE